MVGIESKLSRFKGELLRSLGTKERRKKRSSLHLRMAEIWIVDKGKVKDIGARRVS